MTPSDRNAASRAPFDLATQPLEEAAAKAASLFVSIYRGLEDRPVDPGMSRADVRATFANTLTDEGVGLMRVLEEFEDWVLPASMGTPHPLYLGLVNCSPLPAAALADLLISSLNNNGGAYHQSPAMTTCEEEIVRECGRLFGMTNPEGMIVPGGMFATLQAVVIARARATGGPARPGFRLYASETAHFSVLRSATVAGIAAEDVVSIPVVGRDVMDVDALKDRIARDRRDRATPFAVVATAGTTATGAFDPVREIAELCQEEKIWLHVDACYGGAAILLESMRGRFAGAEMADSIAIDPHKWFFIPVTAALVLTKHRGLAHETFTTSTGSYIPTDEEVDAWQRGVPSTRRSCALAVWMAIRAHGWATIRDAVARNIALTRLLERLLAERGFHVLGDGELSIACARWEPAGLGPEATDQLQAAIARDVVATRKAWFSTTHHAGRTWLRMNMVNLYTRDHHVRELVELVDTSAHRVASRPPEATTAAAG